jgi:hypothetical protein
MSRSPIPTAAGTAPDELATAPLCDVCPHVLSRHDAIGLRFCRATLDGAIGRGCICRSA